VLALSTMTTRSGARRWALSDWSDRLNQAPPFQFTISTAIFTVSLFTAEADAIM
jgi:hypothetical protein